MSHCEPFLYNDVRTLPTLTTIRRLTKLSREWFFILHTLLAEGRRRTAVDTSAGAESELEVETNTRVK